MGCVFAQAISLGIMVCKNIHWMWRACKRNEIEQENPILENPAKNMGVQKVMLHHVALSGIDMTSSQKRWGHCFMPLMLLFRKKSRLLRLCPCKRGHDTSAAPSTFCGMHESSNPSANAAKFFCVTLTTASCRTRYRNSLWWFAVFLYPQANIHIAGHRQRQAAAPKFAN